MNMSSSRQKSNFARTCNLLSRYVKEKGSLNLDTGGKVESWQDLIKSGSVGYATINLLTNLEKSAQPTIEERPVVDISEDSTTAQSKAAPLTIFYSGKILVFEEFASDKAKELFTFAKNTSISSNTLQEKPNHGNSDACISSNISTEITNSSTSVHMAYSSRSVCVPLPPDAANGSNLPIARRSSLHRFLEKRKDRAAARGPYQFPEPPASFSNGVNNSSSDCSSLFRKTKGTSTWN